MLAVELLATAVEFTKEELTKGIVSMRVESTMERALEFAMVN